MLKWLMLNSAFSYIRAIGLRGSVFVVISFYLYLTNQYPIHMVHPKFSLLHLQIYQLAPINSLKSSTRPSG